MRLAAFVGFEPLPLKGARILERMNIQPWVVPEARRAVALLRAEVLCDGVVLRIARPYTDGDLAACVDLLDLVRSRNDVSPIVLCRRAVPRELGAAIERARGRLLSVQQFSFRRLAALLRGTSLLWAFLLT